MHLPSQWSYSLVQEKEVWESDSSCSGLNKGQEFERNVLLFLMNMFHQRNSPIILQLQGFCAVTVFLAIIHRGCAMLLPRDFFNFCQNSGFTEASSTTLLI